MKSEKHSLTQLENLYGQIVAAKETSDAPKFADLLQKLSKLLVWGDRQDADFFEYFCEVRALDLLLQVFSKAKSKDIVIAIIGFFNMLWTNLTRKQTINCLLSHPCILSLQNIKFVALDNQIAQYYINFLKGLSRKLDLDSMHLFMNKRYPSFPLLMQTTRFYNHPEALVRTTCRNIILTCIKLNDAKVKKFTMNFPFCTYYIHECNFIKEYWSIIDNVIELDGDKQFQLQNLDTIIQDHEEILLFVDDFMRIGSPMITHRFIDAFANECMSPLLQALSSNHKIHFSIKTVLYVAYTLIKDITNPIFRQFIIYCLFGKYYSKSLEAKLSSPVERPISYSKQWKFKGFWDSHLPTINEYCVNTYFPNEKKIVSDIYVKLEDQKQKNNTSTERKKYSSEARSIFGLGTNFFQRESEKIQNIFAIPIKSDPSTFKKKCTFYLIAGCSQIFMELRDSINKRQFNKEQCEPNPVRENILFYLKAKDDTLAILTLNLFLTILDCSKDISEQILQFCCINTQPKSFDFSTVIDIEKLLKNCLEMLCTDPPSYRICTYMYCSELISRFAKIFKDFQLNKIPIQIITLSKKALKLAIDRVQVYLYEGKHWEQYISIFNKVVCENEKKHRQKNLFTFGLLQKDENEKQKSLSHEIYDIFATSAEQVAARDFWLYLIVRNTYCLLTRTRYKYEVTYSDQNSSKKAQIFEIGSKYEIESDHQVKAKYKRISSDYGASDSQNLQQCGLIFLGGFLMIGVKNIVKYKNGYEDCIMVMDRSDPRKIMLQMGKVVFKVQLEDAKQSYQLRKHFEQMKSLMFKYQLSLLVKQTEWMLEQAIAK